MRDVRNEINEPARKVRAITAYVDLWELPDGAIVQRPSAAALALAHYRRDLSLCSMVSH